MYYFLSLFILPRLWSRKFILVAGILGAFILYCLIDYVLFYNFLPAINSPDALSTRSIKMFIISSVFLFSIIAFCAYAFFINKLSKYKILQQNEKEKALYLNELNVFKTQLSDHFIFRFLNYCNYKIQDVSTVAKRATELFSGILRYNLSVDPESKVSLANEIQHISNYIELQKLLHFGCYIRFKVHGETEQVFIAPRILISFIENAFKHGQYTNPEHPVIIDLIADGSLYFRVKNKIKSGNKMPGTGTGLSLAKQALEMFYKDRYSLTTETSDDYYISQLTIQHY